MRIPVHTLTASVFLLSLSAAVPGEKQAPTTDWPALVQKPHAKLPVRDLGLRPLLQTPDGKPISTREEWSKERERLRGAWLERLGKPPERPKDLDVREEKREQQD